LESPLECKTLFKILGGTPACHNTCSVTCTPSYKDNSTLKGCLIAHIALTLIEMQRMVFCFKTPLCKIFTTNKKVEKSIKQTDDDLWNIFLTTSILHDMGKLTEQYIKHMYVSTASCNLYKKPTERHITTETHVKHHQISATIARKALRKMSDDYIALKTAYAVLFHHEAIDWKTVEQRLLLSSYLQVALSPLSSFSYTVSHDRLSLFEGNLCKILDQIKRKNIITQLQCSFLVETLNCAVCELMHSQGITLNIDQDLNAEKMREPKYVMPALALYRFIYLADNRAASARSEYWFELIQQVDWNELEDTAQQIQKCLIRRYYYIGLSAIPEKFFEEDLGKEEYEY